MTSTLQFQQCKLCGHPIREINARLQLSACTDCGLIFHHAHLNDAEVEALYSKLYAEGGEYHRIFTANQELLAGGGQPKIGYVRNYVLKQTLGAMKDPFVAEIGASVGTIGKFIQDKGLKYQGFEFHRPTAEKATSYGVNIMGEGYPGLKKFPEAFDVVLAFEVIEHIEDLKECLTLINRSLKNNGLFGFSVPNYDKKLDINANDDRIYQPDPPMHINFFTSGNMSKMMSLFGFEMTVIHKKPMPGPKEFTWKNRKRIWRFLTGRFEGSTLMCVAKKVRAV